MSDPGRLPGIRTGVLLGLALRGIGDHRLRSLVTILVVALAVATVVSTTGRTEAARRSLLARLEAPSSRLVRVVDRAGNTNMSPDAVRNIAALRSVAWVIGLSAAGPLGRNPALGGPRQGYARDAVGVRAYWGDLAGGPLVRVLSGREPAVGEAVAGSRAVAVLGLADRVGTVADEDRGPLAVVGSVAAAPPVENLGAYVLVRGGETDARVTELLVLIRTSAEVEPFVERLPALLSADQGPLGVEWAPDLLAVQRELAADAGALDAAVLGASLGTSILLIGAILFGAIEERRREFGLRRSQGATRATIAALVVIESSLLALLGSALGAGVGTLVVVSQTGLLPDLLLTAAVGTLVSLAAIAGAVPPAAAAALRQPLYVLRSE